LLAGLWVGHAPAADEPPAAKPEKPAAPAGDAQFNQLGKELIKGLKETPGCLGVETARTASGKSLVIAFFENKRAALKWFYSPTHRQAMELLENEYSGKRKPLAGVPEDVPVMAVASVKVGGKPFSDKVKLPISQIAIELYTPLTPGLVLGGSFAPDAFRALAPKPAKAAAQK
jgi:hypothetical protein